jgi:hypothetical protein
MFEYRVLRRIFGPKRDEVTGGWRGQYNEELHNLFSSPSIIRKFKSKRMRWARNVAQKGEEKRLQFIVVKASGKEDTRKTKL